MTIEDYTKIPDRLRAVAGKLVGEPHKELLAIAIQLEQSAPDLLKPSYARTFKRRRSRAAKSKLPFSQALPAGAGQGAANEDRSNDERMEESIELVRNAVEALQAQYDWDTLSVRAKINLLQNETVKLRGAKISSQTLYRPWVRDLW